VQRFVGKFVNKLDAKGRVSVPAQFRQVLSAQQNTGFYCIRSIGHRALNGFGEALFAEADEQLKGLNPVFSRNYVAQATALFAQARYLDLDDDGRVRLPDELVAHAGIEDRVLFAGLDRMFEIWNPAAFEPVERARLEQMQRAYEAEGGL
jgi:MraZ protein